MIDPLERWASFGEKPDYAGPLSADRIVREILGGIARRRREHDKEER